MTINALDVRYSGLAALPSGRPDFIFRVLEFLVVVAEEISPKTIPDMKPRAFADTLHHPPTFGAEGVPGTHLPGIERNAHILNGYFREHLAQDGRICYRTPVSLRTLMSRVCRRSGLGPPETVLDDVLPDHRATVGKRLQRVQ